MIEVIIVIICVGIFSTILGWIKDLIVGNLKKHWYRIIAVIAIIACLIFADVSTAFRVATGFIAVWLVWKAFLKVLNRIQKMRENRLWKWMNKNCSMLGKTSANKILEGSTQIKIPDAFKRYIYSEGKNCFNIVTSFLDFKQRTLEPKVKNAIYDEMRSAGMLGDADVLNCITSKFNRATRTKDLSVMCSESIDLLIKEGNLDRPIKGEKVLHCVGVDFGTNFESEEISI